MKAFSAHHFDSGKATTQLDEFGQLLKSKSDLSELNDILPFFKARTDLSALLGAMTGEIVEFNRLAHEFNVFGDFSCDLAIGDSTRYAYCFIEFEDAREASVFRKCGKKNTLEWGQRFEHGQSQIIDWLWKLDDNKQTANFRKIFGNNEIQSIALLIVGRDLYVTDQERFRWRSTHVVIGHTKLYAYTYDQIFNALSAKLQFYRAMSSV